MIVVDTNIIAYLIIPGPFTELAEKAAKERWCAPVLWRSEFCNVLAVYRSSGRQIIAVFHKAAISKGLVRKLIKELYVNTWDPV